MDWSHHTAPPASRVILAPKKSMPSSDSEALEDFPYKISYGRDPERFMIYLAIWA